jgi:hypothetical protein
VIPENVEPPGWRIGVVVVVTGLVVVVVTSWVVVVGAVVVVGCPTAGIG